MREHLPSEDDAAHWVRSVLVVDHILVNHTESWFPESWSSRIRCEWKYVLALWWYVISSQIASSLCFDGAFCKLTRMCQIIDCIESLQLLPSPSPRQKQKAKAPRRRRNSSHRRLLLRFVEVQDVVFGRQVMTLRLQKKKKRLHPLLLMKRKLMRSGNLGRW